MVPVNHHVMKKNLPITGIRKAAFSENFDLIKIKAYTKTQSCSVNDYIGALIGNSLYEYFEKH